MTTPLHIAITYQPKHTMTNTLDLTKLIGQECLLTLRGGQRFFDLVGDSGEGGSLVQIGGRIYTPSGIFYHAKLSYLDIVSAIPVENITTIEWITDRRPTSDDAYMDSVQVVEDGVILRAHWYVTCGNPWAHCPGWKPPEPSAKEAELAELRQQLECFGKKLQELEG